MSETWIRASEIGDYVYCRRAWWLRRVAGEASRNTAALERGSQFHAAHGQTVSRAVWLRRAAVVVLAAAALVVILGLVV